MFGLNRNTWLLALVQPFAQAIAPAIVFISGFVAKELAPRPELSTLPLSIMVIGVTAGTVPAALLMQKFGRKVVFIGAMLFSASASTLTCFAILIDSFLLFLTGIAAAGMSLAVVQQFRFAAIEGARGPELAGRAVSVLMIGSVLAGFIGTELASAGRDILAAPYAGSYLLLGASSLFAMLLLMMFNSQSNRNAQTTDKSPVNWAEIFKRSSLWVAVASASIGYAVMAFIMTATPLAMHDIHLHSLADTKWVIQSHIMAMYLPSLITGELIRRFGVVPIMWVGLLAFIGTTLFGYAGVAVFHYWWALVLLGVGWNFLFIGGTTLLASVYKPHEKFKVQAMNDFTVFILQSVASLGAGVILFIGGWETIVSVALIPTVILLALLVYYSIRVKVMQSDQ